MIRVCVPACPPDRKLESFERRQNSDDIYTGIGINSRTRAPPPPAVSGDPSRNTSTEEPETHVSAVTEPEHQETQIAFDPIISDIQ